jgi:hypothetical protein
MVLDTEMKIEIQLSEDDMDWCENHANDIVEYYGGNGTQGSGTYNHNKISSNLVGVKSEVATSKWIRGVLKNCKLEENYKLYKKRGLKGDMKLNREVIEVKGLRPHQWDRFKRMIPPKQLTRCVRNKAIVIWTLATGDNKNRKVTLMGWNHASEVEEYGVEVRTICDNIWLAEDDKMHPMSELVTHLR